jgi:hypothetical protein
MPQPRHAAAALIRHYAYDNDPDQRTSMADSRIALNIARGVALDDIDPASGYDYSRAAYDDVPPTPGSWNIKQHWGYSDIYDRDALRRAIPTGTARRPDLLAGDDWLAAATDAHNSFLTGLGIPCDRPNCDLHDIANEDSRDITDFDHAVQESLFAEPTPVPAAAPIRRPRRRSITDLQLPA